MRRFVSWLLLALVGAPSSACAVQAGSDADPAGLGDRGAVAAHQALLDVSNPFTVMCVACHPDDEDGSTLTLERRLYGARTVTLFATSGEGGQNAVGPELYDELGQIRERETREAAEIQGSEPYFLRLRDFGFSKSGDEAMLVWERQMGGHEQLLELFVAAIRTLKPDVIITNHDTKQGHGQHQATSRLLHEAFDAAADPARFAKAGQAWKAQALYVRAPLNSDAPVTMNSSAYDPVRGLTYREQSFRALLRHATQGPWHLESHPRSTKYGLSAGALAKSASGVGSPLTSGLALPQGRVAIPPTETKADAAAVSNRLATELSKRDLGAVDRLRLQKALFASRGLALDLRLDTNEVTPGGTVDGTLELSNGGSAPVLVENFRLLAPNFDYKIADPKSTASGPLGPGEVRSIRLRVTAPVDPLVLNTGAPEGPVERIVNSGLPIDHHPGGGGGSIVAAAIVQVGEAIVTGNVARFVRVTPPLRVSIPPARVSDPSGPTTIPARVQNVSTVPLSFSIVEPGVATDVAGSLAPGEEKVFQVGIESPVTIVRNGAAGSGARPVLAVAPVRVLRKEVEVAPGLRVGYIRSYENTLPESLDLLAVDHTELTPAAVRDSDLSRFDTIVVDNRAYLKYPELVRYNRRLLDYVNAGGNLVVFYHKTGEYDPSLAPYPFTIGGKRITNESAPVEILAPKHPLLTVPNAIGPQDFDGWIQERGLYFPSEWDARYEALLSSSDPGEEALKGGLLVAKFGKGTYVYTSYVWYRQLRGFVPGGFRFFANLISLPKAPKG